jgi:hypothetical protein
MTREDDERDLEIMELLEEGHDPDLLAERFNVSSKHTRSLEREVNIDD